jgi:hypothetical protein
MSRRLYSERSAIARTLQQSLGRRVNLIVSYDNFALGRAAAAPFFGLARELDRRYCLSSTRYCTDAFLRRQLGRAFAAAVSIDARLWAPGRGQDRTRPAD